EGYDFIGWFTDAECTVAVDENATYSENTTLYAGWKEIPKCTDGTYVHAWGAWLPATGSESRTCKDCGLVETRYYETEEE
ncbi:MAG: InlB B-repeat-containing protein, partial [Clostridia bacterium]|nr:InlB B-repeat-containing protein [Clostridia bacterium]